MPESEQMIRPVPGRPYQLPCAPEQIPPVQKEKAGVSIIGQGSFLSVSVPCL